MNKSLLIQKSFSSIAKSQDIIKNIQNFNQKVKLKQTIGDKRNLQKFLETQVKEGKLRSTIQRTSKYDNEFASFLKGYQEKRREFPNILDVSHYIREGNNFDKDPERRKEELLMLSEFRKRNSKNPAFQNIHNEDEEDIDNKTRTRMDMEWEGQDEIITETPGFAPKEGEEGFKEEKEIKGADYFFENRIKKMKNEIFNRDHFMTLLIFNDTTTLITKLNRINHFRYLIFAGNGNGIIGYGKGKGNDPESALDNAHVNLKKNLIAIPLDHFNSFTRTIKTRSYGFDLHLFPRSAGMNAWGMPLVAHMLLLSGITDVRFKCLNRNLNPYALIYAYFDAVTRNKTPQELSEQMGCKQYRQYWGKPNLINNMVTPAQMF